MRRAFLASLLFHGAVAGLVVGLRHLQPALPPSETPVTVEIVSEPADRPPTSAPLPPRPPVAEAAPLPPRQAAAPPAPPPAPTTDAAAEAKPPPPPPQPPAPVAQAKPEPPPPQEAAAPPEPEPPPEPAPEPLRAEVKPPPPRPQPRRPAPPPPAETKPAPRAEVAKAAPRPERPPTPPAPKSEPSDFEALLRSVEAQSRRVQAPERRAGEGAAAEAGGSDAPGEAKTAAVDPSALVAAISRQVADCWNIPIAAQGVGSLRAELAIELGPDGAVRTVEATDTARMASDPVFRAFAESAVRAVRSCSPLKLPPESYQVWRNIIFNFEPAMMAG